MIKVTKFGETIYVKDWHERLADFKKRFPPSDDLKKIFSMSPEELDAHYKKLREKEESNFWVLMNVLLITVRMVLQIVPIIRAGTQHLSGMYCLVISGRNIVRLRLI